MLKKLVLSFLVVFFLISSSLQLFDQPVNAQSDSEAMALPQSRWDDLELARNFIEDCIQGSNLNESIDMGNQDISDLNGDDFFEDHDRLTDISFLVPDGSNNDGQRECGQLGTRVINDLYGSLKNYLDTFYEYYGAPDDKYYIKEEFCIGGTVPNGSDDVSCNRGQATDAIKRNLISRATSEGYYQDGRPLITEQYEYEMLKTIWNECLGNYNPETQSPGNTVRIRGKTYKWQESPSTEKYVGPLIDSGNGVWTCQELANNVNNPSDRWAFVALTENEYSQRLTESLLNAEASERKRQITRLFANNPQTVWECIAPIYSKYPQFRLMTSTGATNYFIDKIVDWSLGRDNLGGAVNDAEIGQVVACLKADDSMGDAFSAIVDRAPPTGTVNPADRPNGGDGDETDTVNCGGSEGLAAFLDFILCPIAGAIYDTIGSIQNEILVPYLTVDPLGSDGTQQVEELWRVFRNISYVLLVLGFMYLIFAETTSFGGEAYQLKRLAPRLVVVTIGISLSWLATGLAIDFFNILGNGINVMTENLVSGSQTSVSGGADFFALLGALGAGFALSGVGIGFIVLILFIGLLILLAVAATILLRSVLIYVLVIVAPLAMVSTLLPNTEKFFKVWWSYFSKALVMFPLIMLLFVGGQIFGVIIQATGGGTTAIGTDRPLSTGMISILSFLGGIAPLALIPFTFKAAGGAIGSVYGAMRGGIGKGYEKLMGSEHDPNSMRRKMTDRGRLRRAGLGRTAANRVAGTSQGGYRVGFKRKGLGYTTKGSSLGGGKIRQSLGKNIMKVGSFQQKLTAARAKEAEGIQSILRMRGGEGSKWLQTGGHEQDGLDLAEELGYSRNSAEAQAIVAAAERHIPKEEVAGIRATASNVSAHLENANYRGSKYGGSRFEAVQLAGGLRSMVEAGDITESDANNIAAEFGKSAKAAGNETVALMGKDWWKKGEYLKREKALAESNQDFLKIVGNTDDKRGEADFKTVLRHLVHRGGGSIEQMESLDGEAKANYVATYAQIGRGKLNEAEAPWLREFLRKAKSNTFYNSGADADTMIARDSIFKALGESTGNEGVPLQPPEGPEAPPMPGAGDGGAH